ncbi:MAG TPA: nicotinamide-nucleotide amidohydrolase family protein, partial [Clostridia bacterium]|nr:nicotinamide-nucleotide amidohydrolase family protein [Clostridia bacterium]
IAYLVNPGEVQLKITVHGDNPSFMKEHMVQVEGIIQEHFGDYIFGKDNERPEVLVGNLLTEKNLSIGLAESCTGGLIGAALTSVPGSSRYFQGGIISYANSVKKKVLGVPENILEKCGAVSEETACYMARGARKALGSDIGLAVTGVAGPDGGTAEKPVGLVYVALYDGGKTICRRYTLPGARKAVRKGVVNVSLNIARQYLTDGVPKMQC